ncbi:hypothetical protein F0562_008356 [Nyssa sinensis]|uniref:HTH myb-type domain-containing protein n=1 Tax=Nyssa sinensis TaxID=561372 RepID=A0A5J5AAT1_9ASTE|nr:hypothetical protein F0562_008356 [Nyssa sinensis]
MAFPFPHTVKLLEHCQISPPPGSVPQTSLPLTFFDIPWLLFSPSQPLFFYEFPHSTAHFTTTILPNLKHSLSLTLQHFFPFAGNLSTPPQPTKPRLLYTDGDSVSLTIAESAADFTNLSGHHPRDVRDFHHLVPQLPPCVSSDPHVHPLLALQFTVFPKRGICLGFTFRNVLADGRTFNRFIKSWASIYRMKLNLDSPPFFDRSMINDPNELEPVLLKEWRKLEKSQKEAMATGLEDMTRATFVVGRPEMDKLKQWILTRSNKLFGSYPLLLSPYVLTCAFVWVCLIKAQGTDIGNAREDPLHYFGFIAGGITRLDFPVPTTYFGNCVSFGRSAAKRNELTGEDGIAVAGKAIGDAIKKLNERVLGDAENWISDWQELFGSEHNVTVTGSPKLDLYELDFGWGRPRKIEEISIDGTRAVSLTESRDVEGGIEVGLALSRAKMDAFTCLFTEELQRCGKSCRLRWTNYLRPDIRRGRFSFEEEETIIQLHSILGNKWSAIAARLPGRTDNEIKNYWNTHIRKRLLRMGIDPVTHSPRLDLLDLSSILSSAQQNLSNLLGLQTLINPELLRLATNLLASNHGQNPDLLLQELQENQLCNTQLQNQTPLFQPNQFQTPIQEAEAPSYTSSGSSVPCNPYLSQTQHMQGNMELSSTIFQENFTPSNLTESVVSLQNYGYFGSDQISKDVSENSTFQSLDNNNKQNFSFDSVISTPLSSPTPLNSSSTFINSSTEDERESYCSNLLKFEIPESLDFDDFM